jgi:hypothetical protein
MISYHYIKKLKNLDEKYLFNLIKITLNFFRRFNARKFKINKVSKNINFYIVDYNVRVNDLTKLCEKYGSDKGGDYFKNKVIGLKHTYTDFYYDQFNKVKSKILNIFELGIGTNNLNIESNMTVHGKPGASLKVWRDFFLNANVYGGDIDKNILFNEERIQTFYVDQKNSETIKSMWSMINNKFDIIIDDGLHSFDANINFYEHSFENLKKGGMYIIEDIKLSEQKQFYEYFEENKNIVKHISLNSKAAAGHTNLVLIEKTY